MPTARQKIIAIRAKKMAMIKDLQPHTTDFAISLRQELCAAIEVLDEILAMEEL